MTHLENIEAIRTKCIEANPEIVEMKWGCNFLYGNKKPEYPARFENWASRGDIVRALDLTFGQQKRIHLANVKCEIIGRPIHLADVLLALAEARVGMLADGSYQEPGMINIFPAPDSPRRMMQEPTYCRWNGRKDDLTEQSDDCLSFLADLLNERHP